jgi:hypothetical protein
MSKKLILISFLLLSLATQGHAAVQINDTVVFIDPPKVAAITPDVVPADTLTFEERKFEQGFQDSYTEEDFVYERKAAGLSQWDRFMEWLSRLLKDIFTFSRESGTSKVIVVLIRVIAIGIILFVVYLIVRAILDKEGMWIFGRQRKKIQVEDITAENIHEMDFNQLVNETKDTGNYRLAVRYYYLWVLKKLSLREIIDWDWDKTNSDYLYEIKDSGLKKDFEYLSYLYDYSWYGEFPLDANEFARAEKAFQKTLNTL